MHWKKYCLFIQKKTKSGCYKKTCCTRRLIGGKNVKTCKAIKNTCPIIRKIKCFWSNEKNNCKKRTCCTSLIHKNKLVSRKCATRRTFCPVNTRRTCKRIVYKK